MNAKAVLINQHTDSHTNTEIFIYVNNALRIFGKKQEDTGMCVKRVGVFKNHLINLNREGVNGMVHLP